MNIKNFVIFLLICNNFSMSMEKQPFSSIEPTSTCNEESNDCQKLLELKVEFNF